MIYVLNFILKKINEKSIIKKSLSKMKTRHPFHFIKKIYDFVYFKLFEIKVELHILYRHKEKNQETSFFFFKVSIF